MRIRFTLAIFLLIFVSDSTLSQQASGGPASSTDKPRQLSTDELCENYANISLPAEASVPVPQKFPTCTSYRSYRGIGRPVNYAEARACAWQERQAQIAHLGQASNDNDSWVAGGSLILADIYINGTGVKRNLPLAIHLACEADQNSGLMVSTAIADYTNHKTPMRGPGLFEFCDYGANTFSMDFCMGYELQVGEEFLARFYAKLKASMTMDQQAAFEKLLSAQKQYVDAHAQEVDRGGTMRGIRTLGSMDILDNLFHTDIVHFERNQWSSLPKNETSTADAILDREYKKKLEELKKQTKEQIDEGAVSADGLANAESAWLSYRDAWVAFARLRYPAQADAIHAKVSLDRNRLLKTIDSYNTPDVQ